MAGRNVYGDLGGQEYPQTRGQVLREMFTYSAKVISHSQYGKPGTPKPRGIIGISFRNLPMKGKIDPKKVRFSQDNISGNFKDKTSVSDLTKKLKSGAVSSDAVAPIRIVEKDGLIYTLDNRRLKAFQDAGVPVNYKKLNTVPANELFKFSIKNNGVSIEVRGNNR